MKNKGGGGARMNQLFQRGVITNFEAEEDIMNSGIYVIDRDTQKVRTAKNIDEYLFNQVVLVNNVDFKKNREVFPIKKGTMCRCWIIRIII